MVKVYKSKNDKLIIYVPFEVAQSLKLKEGDETDFIKYGDASFLFAKKSDIADLLTGKSAREQQKQSYSAPQAQQDSEELSKEEISVLKKLDTLKYGMRTKENVVKMLGRDERILLKGLIKRKAVSLFAKDKSKEPLFSISKNVYDKFLMRKKVEQQQRPSEAIADAPRLRSAQGGTNPADENSNVARLEKDGFIVLQSEPEASSLSLALEGSIRRGQVLGTRSFNKKFYIILRTFFDRHGPKILKALKDGDRKVSQVADEIGVDEDGVRAILYLLAESGDVSEKRKDVFTLA